MEWQSQDEHFFKFHWKRAKKNVNKLFQIDVFNEISSL
jgi:hypothetical protein